ncbi:uncharacterized protein [Parasteatoda tepidariorum]|uniref:uncharacterized protein n=1 Tax=Parasteatoda tepidariorum TaxID=114398 RepID=UPI0039BCEDA7
MGNSLSKPIYSKFQPYSRTHKRSMDGKLENENSPKAGNNREQILEQINMTKLNNEKSNNTQISKVKRSDLEENEPKIATEHLPADEDIKCSICQDSQTFTDMFQLPCTHKFHAVCLIEWLQRKSMCPICRLNLEFPSDNRDDPEEAVFEEDSDDEGETYAEGFSSSEEFSDEEDGAILRENFEDFVELYSDSPENSEELEELQSTEPEENSEELDESQSQPLILVLNVGKLSDFEFNCSMEFSDS